MVQDRQKVWTDGRTGGRTDGMDGRTTPKLYPSLSGDNYRKVDKE